MNTNLINISGSLANITRNIILTNFSDFMKGFKGNMTGVIFSVSIRDNSGAWHTMAQRVFKNGSVHTRIS